MNRTHALLAAAFVVISCAMSAHADVDVAIGNGDTINGTLSPSSEQETFRIQAPTLAVMNVVVKGKKAKGAAQSPAMRLRVIDPTGFDFLSSSIVTTPTGAKLTNAETFATGDYRVVVSSSNGVAGDYQLQIKWKSRTPLLYGTINLGAGITNYSFAADAGAVPTFNLTVPKGSPVRPWLQKFTEPFGTYNQTFPQPPAGTTKLKIKGAAFPATANYGAFVTDIGGAGGGPVKVTITLKRPKPSKRKTDLTGGVLAGSANGDSVARGAVVGSAGGVVGVGASTGTPIDGASVTIPAGALTAQAVIVVGLGNPIPASAGRTAIGPTIVFGPESSKFKTDVTITIPLNPALLVGGNPASVQVLTRDAKGHVSQVTAALTVDLVGGMVSFPSSRFGAYRAFGP